MRYHLFHLHPTFQMYSRSFCYTLPEDGNNCLLPLEAVVTRIRGGSPLFQSWEADDRSRCGRSHDLVAMRINVNTKDNRTQYGRYRTNEMSTTSNSHTFRRCSFVGSSPCHTSDSEQPDTVHEKISQCAGCRFPCGSRSTLREASAPHSSDSVRDHHRLSGPSSS